MALQTKLQVLRALSSHIATKAIRLFAVITSTVLVVLLVAIWALAHFITAWWWLLLLLYIPLLVASLAIYLVASFLASKLYKNKLTHSHRQQLDAFVDKIMELLEARGLGWWWFCALCIRDLVYYRELRTLNGLLDTTKSLTSDFAKLESTIS